MRPPVWATAPIMSSPSPVASLPSAAGLPAPGVLPVRRHQLHGLSAATAAKRARADQSDRRAALASIVEIVGRRFPHASSIQTIRAESGTLSPDSVSLGAMAERKATSTLQKRASSLRMYDSWFASSGASSQFGDEVTVFRYCAELYQDAAPATRAAALVASLNFIEGMFSIDLLAVRSSERVQGMCVKSMRTRGAVRQRRPLTVALVRTLEGILSSDGGRGGADGVLAGAALFAAYGRIRIGDLRRCTTEPVLDTVEGHGYVETFFHEHKTAVPGSRRALPIAAPAFGLTGPWAADWAATRRGAGLNAVKDETLLPALGVGGMWLQVPYTTVEFASAVRDMLVRRGVLATELDNIGAHSLKSTMLSWAAKFGLEKGTRRSLGYHAEPGDKSVETYSRDALAGPLRELDRLLEAVRRGSFEPDSTRSGYFVKSDGQPRDRPPEHLHPQVVGDRASEELSRLSTPRHPLRPQPDLHLAHPISGAASSAGPAVEGTASARSASSASVASSASSSSADPDADEVRDQIEDSARVVKNKATGIFHVASEAGILLCKQAWNPKRYEEVSRRPPPGSRLCSRCF